MHVSLYMALTILAVVALAINCLAIGALTGSAGVYDIFGRTETAAKMRRARLGNIVVSLLMVIDFLFCVVRI